MWNVSAALRTRYTPVRKNSSSTSFSLVATTKVRIGRPIMRATWPAQMLPKLPDGTAKDTLSSFERVLPFIEAAEANDIYVVLDLKCEPAAVLELDRRLNLNDSILRTKVLRGDR